MGLKYLILIFDPYLSVCLSVCLSNHLSICLGSTCKTYANDSHYRAAARDDCYVAFPLLNRGAHLTWYQARRNCWRLGGDLARSKAVLSLTSSSWPGPGNFSVGLHRDEYVWIDGGTVHTASSTSLRMVFACDVHAAEIIVEA